MQPANREEGNRPVQKPDPPTEKTSPQNVRIVDLAHSVEPGNDITLIAQAKPGVTCSIAYVTPSGNLSSAAGLAAKVAGAVGTVSWTWRIGSSTAAGAAKVKVTCGSESTEGSFVVQRTARD